MPEAFILGQIVLMSIVITMNLGVEEDGVCLGIWSYISIFCESDFLLLIANTRTPTNRTPIELDKNIHLSRVVIAAILTITSEMVGKDTI